MKPVGEALLLRNLREDRVMVRSRNGKKSLPLPVGEHAQPVGLDCFSRVRTSRIALRASTVIVSSQTTRLEAKASEQASLQIFGIRVSNKGRPMRVEHTVSAGLFFFAVLAFIVLSCPVSILAQEKPEPLIQPSPVPSSQPAPQQPNNPGNESVLVNTDLISFNVTVTDTYGRFVSGLSKKAFAVYDDKK